MKKKIFFLLGLAIVTTVLINVSHSASKLDMSKILANVEALATDSESGGSSSVVGKCEDTKDACERKCPGSGCTTKYSGSSGKKGPLKFVSGTCSTCGHVF